MLWAVALVLGLLWALGMATAQFGRGYLHLLIAVAIVVAGYGVYQRYRERRAP